MKIIITSQLTNTQKAKVRRVVDRRREYLNEGEPYLIPVEGNRSQYIYVPATDHQATDVATTVHHIMVGAGFCFDYRIES